MLDLLTTPLAVAMLLQAPGPQVLAPLDLDAAGADQPVSAGGDEVLVGSVLDLRRRPELRLGVPQRVVAQVCREVDDWSSFLTRFDPAAFQAFEFWADEQLLWIKEEFDAPQARLFARRGSRTATVLAAASAHDRLELQVVVREMHAGRAWIEVTEAQWSDQQTPQGTVLHAIRALDLMQRDGWTLAISQLERALAPDLPLHVRAALERLRAECVAETEALSRD